MTTTAASARRIRSAPTRELTDAELDTAYREGHLSLAHYNAECSRREIEERVERYMAGRADARRLVGGRS